jgi:hypothetical protein
MNNTMIKTDRLLFALRQMVVEALEDNNVEITSRGCSCGKATIEFSHAGGNFGITLTLEEKPMEIVPLRPPRPRRPLASNGHH